MNLSFRRAASCNKSKIRLSWRKNKHYAQEKIEETFSKKHPLSLSNDIRTLNITLTDFAICKEGNASKVLILSVKI